MYINNKVILLVSLQIIIGSSFTVASVVKETTHKPRCSWPSEWIVQEENTCYGRNALPTPVGSFKIRGNHTLVAIRLVHKSGGLLCPYSANPSRWGCRRSPCNSDCFTTLLRMVKEYTPINFESRDYRNLYAYPGYFIDDDVLVIKPPDWPIKVKDGDQINIMSYGGANESGFHCVRVEASFIL